MPCLPSRFAAAVPAFAPLFLQRSWRHAEVLLAGTILAPGKRTVTSLLRIMGLARERRFVNYHRVRCWGCCSTSSCRPDPSCWASNQGVCRTLTTQSSADGAGALQPKVSTAIRCAPAMGTSHKASGLRWLSLMLLAPIPWAKVTKVPSAAADGRSPEGGRVWAMPFLTALAPSERPCHERGRHTIKN